MSRVKLTKNFYLDEFERSETAARIGLDNSVPEQYFENCLALAQWLQELRDKLCKAYRKEIAIFISSGYRGQRLNKKIRGSRRSDHCIAFAADITCTQLTVDELFAFIQENMTFDQIINEFGQWVHVNPEGANVDRVYQCRNQSLWAYKQNRRFRKPKTIYSLIPPAR